MSFQINKLLYRLTPLLPYALCILFFIAYSILSVVRHNNYQSFGYDLGINDQVVWEYSTFHAPITTIDHVPFISKLTVHVEIIYALISPFYWIWSDARTLLIIQVAFFCFSGIPIFLLAKEYKLHPWLQYALLLGYFTFYGTQNALWFDAHSTPFGTACTAWFIYFLIKQKNKWALLSFLLAITTKENVALRTFCISAIYFIVSRKKSGIYFSLASFVYLAFIFGIYFPHFVTGGYRFANSGGLLSNIDFRNMYNTNEKVSVYLYTFFSYGFLAFLNPLYLLTVFANLASYFILGSSVTTAQGLYLQYRIELAPLMTWATIATAAKYKWLNTKLVALYLIACLVIVQYVLHLPLSYLFKQWFWTQPPAVHTINTLLKDIPKDASVVTQDNIVPHLSERYNIFVLWPEERDFIKHSPCRQKTCNWFRWAGTPQFLIVDTSSDWDTRHLLVSRPDFLSGLQNLEKAKVIQKYQQMGSTIVYKVKENPNQYK